MSRLMRQWNDMRASFWFLPCLILVLAIGLAFGLTHLDKSALARSMQRY
ncbi:MAG: DUF2254 domain-containing protein, partial [Massilia sp.]|nr:DUF2254 domain-containing protein [Massilia sp.]